MKTQALSYEADGLAMTGHLAWDETVPGPRPGVLVFPEAFGLGEHAKARAERIASELGYVALACDLHGERRAYGRDEFPTVMGLLAPMRTDASKVRARVVRPLATLAALPEVDASRIAAIGYCFGGTMAYELALAGADIRAAIGFHSGLAVTSPGDAALIRAKVLALIGADDPLIPPESRDAFAAMLRAGGVDWQLTVYGGVVHSFTNAKLVGEAASAATRYDARADARSWRQMSDLLAEVFAGA